LSLLSGAIGLAVLTFSLNQKAPEMTAASGPTTGYVGYTLDVSNQPTNVPNNSSWNATPIHQQTLSMVDWTYRGCFLSPSNHDSHVSLTNTDPSPFVGNKTPIARMAYLTLYVRTTYWAQLFIKGSHTYSEYLSGYDLISTVVLSPTNGGAPGEIGRTETFNISGYEYVAICGGGQIFDIVSANFTCTPDGTASSPYSVSSSTATLTSGQAYLVTNHHTIGYNTIVYAPMDAMKFANLTYSAQDTVWDSEFQSFPVEASWTMVYIGHDANENKDMYAFLNNKTGYFLYFNGTTFSCSSANATYWLATPTTDGGYKFSAKISNKTYYLNRDKGSYVYTASLVQNDTNRDYVFYFFAYGGHFMNAAAWAEYFLVITASACSSNTMNPTLWAAIKASFESSLFASAYGAIASTTIPSDPSAYATASSLVKAVWRYRVILINHPSYEDFIGIGDTSLTHVITKKPDSGNPISATLIAVFASGFLAFLAIAIVYVIERKKKLKKNQ